MATFEALEPRLLLDGAFGENVSQTLALFDTSPALFVENQGQWADASVRYAFLRDGANVLFTDAGPVFQVVEEDAYTRFSVTFDGANASAPVGEDLSDGVFNYYLGDPSNWRDGVPAYLTVAYSELYDGIDLVTWGRRNGLKYEFHVAPGADYQQIRVDYAGIESLVIDEVGRLHVRTAVGELVEEAPTIYQETGDGRVEVAGAFELIDSDTYTFSVTGAYDPTRELIIDPDLDWSTNLGGSGTEAQGVAVDGADNVLVTGETESSGWVSGGYDTSYNNYQDAYVVKLSPTGAHLWSTYLGGAGPDYSGGISVDASGNVLVTGSTRSSGWVSGGYDTTFNGGRDAFVVKLSATGAHLWSTYLGGGADETGYGIAVDASDNVLVTGRTQSSGWVSGGYDTTLNGQDAFVVKLSPTGAHSWSTYVGGSDDETGYGIAVDTADNALVAVYTYSTVPVITDASVVKLSSTGAYLWDTGIGGSGNDCPRGIAVDGSSNVLVTGYTESSGWVSGGYDTTLGGTKDGFVVKLDWSGAHLWSTYLGGGGNDGGYGIAADGAGNVLVTGYTYSSGWVSGGYDTDYSGTEDAYVVELSPTGAHLWSTYVGGVNYEWGSGIAADASGNVLMAGTNNFGAGIEYGFVVKITVAETFTVTTLTDVVNPTDGLLSLREALVEAHDSPAVDTIDFDSGLFTTGPQTMVLSGSELVIDSNVVIDGPGAEVLTIDGNNASRVFHISGDFTATIEGLTITGGYASPYGGGIYAFSSSTLTVSNSTISGNTADYGGGIFNWGVLNLTGTTITGNTADYGGGIHNNYTGTVDVTDGTIEGNSAENGGGIYNWGVLNLTGTTISGNTGSTRGGGVLNDGGGTIDGTMTIANSTISGNTSDTGGGIYSAGGTVTVTNTTISDNTAGGGIYCEAAGTLMVTNSTISDNTGGGIESGATAALTVTNSTISGNTGSTYGGIYNAGTLTITNSTISDNSGSYGGGFYFNGYSGWLTLTNSTISGNSADRGGGIYLTGIPGWLSITDSTITGNWAETAGGGIYTPYSCTLHNTIVAGNVLSDDSPDDVNGAFETSSSYNLIGVGDGSTGLTDGVNGNQVGSAASPIDPLLGPLQNNGGPTETHALLAGSPAIDAGSDARANDAGLTTDQRGELYPRFLDGDDDGTATVDIGAFEARSALFPRDWSSYVGGSSDDSGYAIAVDGSGNVLVTGYTYSPGWVSGGYDTSHNGSADAFVVKLSPTGTHLWSTYLGGSDYDYSHGISVDASDNILVTGYTCSSGWVSGGYDTSHNGSADAFVVKLSPTGAHVWSTYLGAEYSQVGRGIAVDASDNVLVTGYTASPLSWISGGYDTTYDNWMDGFVVKLSPAGAHLWSSYLGGVTDDYGKGIATDASGNVLVTGYTDCSGWVSGGYDTTLDGMDAFVVKLSPTGAHSWSTYVGGSGVDQGYGIAVDTADNALVAVWSTSPPYTDSDASVVKLSSTGAHLWTTAIGGSDSDCANGIATDGSNNVLVTGYTDSSGWVSGGYDTTYNGSEDAYVVELSPTGAHLWSTYVGGSDGDRGNGIATDASGNVLVTGRTESTGWVSGGYDTAYGGAYDGFVAKIMVAETFTVTTLNDVVDPTDGLLSLREALVAAYDSPGDDTIDFHSDLFLTGPQTMVLSGSALVIDSGSNVVIDGPGAELLTIDGNDASHIFVVYWAVNATISGLTITGGYAESGGGVYCMGSLTITDSSISDNTAGEGGGIYNTGPLNLIAVTITDNTADTNGGGIYNTGGLSLTGVTITGNTTGSDGGGLHNHADVWHSGSATVTNSTISGNTAGTNGGGIDFHGTGLANLTITNSTISGNTAGSEGGGIRVAGGISPCITNSTITGNSSVFAGGGIFLALSGYTPLALHNTIVAGNVLSDDSPDDVNGAFETSSSYNLIGVGDGSTGLTDGVNGNQVGSAASPIDPLLGPLQNNGGPTETHALLAGSPAIDAGSDARANDAELTTDQRGDGYPRFVDGDHDATATVDIGAFEYHNTDPYAEAGPDQTVDEETEVSFDGSASSDADSDTLSYLWDFGDGETATGPTPTHVYADHGEYLVTLTVEDGFGGSDTDTLTVTVNSDETPPSLVGVELNGYSDRQVSQAVSDVDGLTSVELTFSEAVNLSASNILVQKVTFPGDVERLGATVAPSGVTDSGTSVVTVTFASDAIVDTWVKVTLYGTGGTPVMDLAGNALDGEPNAGGSGRGYIYSASTDLPSGDGTIGGDAAFFVGSLVGDASGDGKVGFADAFRLNQAWGSQMGDPNYDPMADSSGDGRVGFADAYQLNVHWGQQLDTLPTTLGAVGFLGSVETTVGVHPAAFDAPSNLGENLQSTASIEETVPDGEAQASERIRPGVANTPTAPVVSGGTTVATPEATYTVSPTRLGSNRPLGPKSPTRANVGVPGIRSLPLLDIPLADGL